MLDFGTLVVVVLVGSSQAQTWRNPINISMCNWGSVRVNTIRDTVYLDGGSLWWQTGYDNGDVSTPESTNNNEGSLYYLNLSSSFNTATTNLTSLFGTIPKLGGNSNLAPTYQDGVMFANDYKFYLYGGLLVPTDSQDDAAADRVLAYERFEYGPHSNLWEPGFIEDQLDDDMTRYVTDGAGVSVPSENLGFYVSGMRAPGWGPIWDNETATRLSQQMIRVDMSEMRDPVWSNLTIPDSVPARANAEAVWVPVSDSGVIVLVGGVNNPESIYTAGLSEDDEDESRRISPAFMETVSVYDIATDRWYNQNTTGDIPPQLTQFCSVYASAPDDSSHNIYIYGGYDGLSPASTPSDDVYVLSLPSFEWIKLYSGDSRAHGRKWHKCVKPYPDQMLVLGGTGLDPVTCVDMIRVFNLNTGRFQDTYDPTEWSEYEVPDLVAGRIGGDSSGGATKTAPESWTNASLEDVFTGTYTKTIETWYPYESTSTGTVTPTTVPDSDGASFPNWAGAIIGVVVGLIVIGSAVGFWLVRRRKKRGSRPESEISGGSRVRQWVHQGAFSPSESKDPENATTISAGISSTVAPSTAATGYSRPTAEANSEPIYELPVGEHPTELPTSYNDQALPAPAHTPEPAPSPSPSASPRPVAYMSPVSPEIPQEKEGDAPSRQGSQQGHHRNVSSLSSIPSYSQTYEEDGDNPQRPHYVSGVSEVSDSSDGTGLGTTATARDSKNRGLGLEDIPDLEDR
ncbi:uncharacterized protein BJX67DRAFT_366303 [Aspergillus lucknowensis]|uniref:Kelch repeat protein n=1 Tax=Aspergillus lucknowensis TaxID=176173 RepID=A0ABR4LDK4_9EURO